MEIVQNKKIEFGSTDSLLNKWKPVLECTDQSFDMLKDTMPNLKSNQKHLLAMMLEQVEKLVLETSVSGDLEQFQPILIPMLRRIVPSLIGMEIFGVQPLSTPSGLIFALRALYAGTEANVVKYSTSQIVILADATAFAASTGSAINIIRADGVGGIIRYKEGNKLLVEITTNIGGDGVGTDRFDINDPVEAADTWGGPGDSTVASQTANEALYQTILASYSGSVTTAAGEALGTDMREVGVTIERETATSRTRKLKSSYTREMAEDLQSCHGYDAVTLLTQIGSEEIIIELNREAIDLADAHSVVGGVTPWNYNTADGRWEVEKYQNLAAKISRVSRELAKSTRRGQGNFMIVDTSTLVALEMSGRLDASNVDPVGTSFVGMFNGYIKVFVDLFSDDNQIIMGYKGNSELDAGVFFSPYVPLKITQGTTQEGDQPRLFFRMRYALTSNPFGAPNFFRKIELSNLPA